MKRVVSKALNKRGKVVDNSPELQDVEVEESLWSLYTWESDRLLGPGGDGLPELIEECDFFGFTTLDTKTNMHYEGYTAGGGGVDGFGQFDWASDDGSKF